jgi:hypothetical protein
MCYSGCVIKLLGGELKLSLLWCQEVRTDVRNRLILHFRSLSHVSICLLFLFLATPGMARAQATGGSISGTVTRETGGTMPGVRVSLSDVAKTVSREITADNDGVYNLPDLPPAVYEITVSAPGFVTQMWTAITVGAGTDRAINIVKRRSSR